MNDDVSEFYRLTDAMAAAQRKLAEIETLDGDELRHALKEHMRRADVWSGTIAKVDELRDNEAKQQVIDYRRNVIADLEIKLAQVVSRLGGEPPQPKTETQAHDAPQQ